MYTLHDGRQIRLLSWTSFQLCDIDGRHISYGVIEHIEYPQVLRR